MARAKRGERAKAFLMGVLVLSVFLFTAEALVASFSRRPVEPYPVDARSPNQEWAVLQYDPVLLWKQKPNKFFQDQIVGTVRTNSFGLRGGDFPGPLHGKSFLVLCLGDSPTWGHGIQDPDIYHQALGRLLSSARSDVTVRVLNGGVPAYSTVQSLALEKELMRAVRFDLVIINNMGSDYRLAERHDREYQRSDLGYTVHGLLAKSRLYCFLRGWILERDRRMHRPPGPQVSRVSLADYAANLGEMIAVARKNGADVLMIPPLPMYPRPEDRIAALEASYRDAMGRVAVRAGVTWVDVTRQVGGGKAVASLYLDALHPTVKGHLLLARALYPEALSRLERKFPLP